jgi:uncharacterized OB-fold protein
MSKKEKVEIQWKKCDNCSFLQHNSHLRCLKCKNDTFSKIHPSGLGTLISYTILKAPPMKYREKKSYALGIIEFSNGIRAMGQITTEDNLQIGMKLKPVFKEIYSDLNGKKIKTYMFEPI